MKEQQTNEREMTVLKSVLNENNELDFFASLEKMGGEIKSDKRFIGKVLLFIGKVFGLLFLYTIILVIVILGLGLVVEYIPILYILFWLVGVLALISKILSK